jgi:hypothetical protein
MSVNGEYLTEVVALRERFEELASGVRTRYPRWISTPDGDLGSEWCSDCGYYKVRNLRRRDRKRAEDYILDGGWQTEEDHFCHCVACGVRLDVSLTDYGVQDAVRCFEECGFSTNPAEDAYEISEILGALDYRYGEESDETRETRAAIVAIAQRYIADQVQP